MSPFASLNENVDASALNIGNAYLFAGSIESPTPLYAMPALEGMVKIPFDVV